MRRGADPPPARVLSAGRSRPGLDPGSIAAAVVVAALLWLVLLAGAYVARELVWPAIASSAPLPSSTIAYWDGVAQCETGGHWRGLGSTYQGGLGFYASTWDEWARELGLDRRYPDAGDAPRLVQIRVADYGARVHDGYWGCR